MNCFADCFCSFDKMISTWKPINHNTEFACVPHEYCLKFLLKDIMFIWIIRNNDFLYYSSIYLFRYSINYWLKLSICSFDFKYNTKNNHLWLRHPVLTFNDHPYAIVIIPTHLSCSPTKQTIFYTLLYHVTTKPQKFETLLKR